MDHPFFSYRVDSICKHTREECPIKALHMHEVIELHVQVNIPTRFILFLLKLALKELMKVKVNFLELDKRHLSYILVAIPEKPAVNSHDNAE